MASTDCRNIRNMRSLLSDVLAQTQAHSHIPLAWHRLYELWEATPDASARQAVLSRLESLALADPHSDLLRLTFLRDACKSNRLDARIAERTLDMQIPGCDRMASFIAHVWGLAVKMQTDHQAFVHHLNEAKVPTLVTRLTAVAVDQLPQQCLPKSKPASQRIAIVTPYVGNRLHTPSSQVAAQCQVLSQAGKDVAIFSCQELLVPDQRFFNGGTEEVLFPKFDIDYWQSVLPQRVQLTYSDVRFSLETRWKIMLEALFNFDPDVVLFCGFYSPLAGALYQMRPVVCLNVHALPPLAPADVWLSANEHQTMSAQTDRKSTRLNSSH